MRRLPLVSFLLFLSLSACGSSDPGSVSSPSGVRGQVLLGPTCPVEQEGSPCPDRPLSDVEVRVLSDGETIAETTSGEGGRFEVVLPPGVYTLEAVVGSDDPGMSAKPVNVTVTSGAFVDVVVPIDSGIR